MLRLGIDIGGTNIRAGIVNDSFEIIARGSRRSHAPRRADEFCDDVAGAVREAAQNAGVGLSELMGAGAGCPGAVNAAKGRIEYSGNLEFEGVEFAAMLESRLGIPIKLENDANCAALGEVLAGAAKGASSAVVVTIGTGVGAGIIIDSKIFSGVGGSAGEFGHTLLIKDGDRCTCGRRGCLEAYASATALKKQTRQAMEQHPDSLMWTLSDGRVSGKTAFAAARLGDPAAQAVVMQYLDYLADGLTDLMNILQPEVVCLGGGVSREGDALLLPLERLIAERRFSRGSITQPRLVCAHLLSDAGLIGAAFL